MPRESIDAIGRTTLAGIAGITTCLAESAFEVRGFPIRPYAAYFSFIGSRFYRDAQGLTGSNLRSQRASKSEFGE